MNPLLLFMIGYSDNLLFDTKLSAEHTEEAILEFVFLFWILSIFVVRGTFSIPSRVRLRVRFDLSLSLFQKALLSFEMKGRNRCTSREFAKTLAE